MKLSTRIKKYGCWLCSDNDTIMETIIIRAKAEYTEFHTHSLSIADRIDKELKASGIKYQWELGGTEK